jgi:hypothetical protein
MARREACQDTDFCKLPVRIDSSRAENASVLT